MAEVTVFKAYPFKKGQKIRIEDSPRPGDWEVVKVTDHKVTLRCPISKKEFTWNRFCYFEEKSPGPLALKRLERKMPMEVILLMATTLDGMIARDSDQLVDWTGKADKQYFVKITKQAGAMIMGSKTYDTIGRPLPGRLNIVMTRDKSRVSHDETLIFTDDSPGNILKDLESRGYTQVALIGGAMINSLFARENLITQIHLTLIPVLFGTGLSLFNKDLDLGLKFQESREIDPGHILMIYRVTQ